MSKRGQAAVEFLMTYGWAILAATIAIAALIYFGILRPGAFIPAQCGTGGVLAVTGLGCTDFKIETGQVTLMVHNGLGNDVSITAMTVTPDGGTACTGVQAIDIADEGDATVVVTGCTNGATGDKFKGTVSFDYSTDTIVHSASDQVTGKVE